MFDCRWKETPVNEPKKKKRKVSKNLDQDPSIPENTVFLRNQIEKVILRQKNHSEIKIIIKSLVHDQLLNPDKDFMEALREGKDDCQDLPRNLIKVWSDVISMISNAGYLPELLEELSEAPPNAQKTSQVWITRILHQVATPNDKSKMLKIAPKDHQQDKWNHYVENSIIKKRLKIQDMELLGKIRDPVLSKNQVNQLKNLLNAFQTCDQDNDKVDETIKTVEDLNAKGTSSTSIWNQAVQDPDFGHLNLDISSLHAQDTKSIDWLEQDKEYDDEIYVIQWHDLMLKNVY